MTDLEVPDQAIVELNAWTDDYLAPSDRGRAVCDIAGPVVVAELRAQARHYAALSGAEQSADYWHVSEQLEARADELEGQ